MLAKQLFYLLIKTRTAVPEVHASVGGVWVAVTADSAITVDDDPTLLAVMTKMFSDHFFCDFLNFLNSHFILLVMSGLLIGI